MAESAENVQIHFFFLTAELLTCSLCFMFMFLTFCSTASGSDVSQAVLMSLNTFFLFDRIHKADSIIHLLNRANVIPFIARPGIHPTLIHVIIYREEKKKNSVNKSKR